jgi:hypothetical protein
MTESTPSWRALGATASETSRKSEFGLGNTAGGSGHKKNFERERKSGHPSQGPAMNENLGEKKFPGSQLKSR